MVYDDKFAYSHHGTDPAAVSYQMFLILLDCIYSDNLDGDTYELKS
jgi:hypothetical protein